MPQLTMDVFNQDAFSAQNLTAGVDKEGFTPTFLRSMPGLFVPPPLGQPRSKWIMIETRLNEPVLIQTSERGSPPKEGRNDEGTRDVRPFKVPRLSESKRITASEIAGIRAYGSITEMQSLAMMVQRRQYLMQNDFALTWENLCLGAVQGITKDADGTNIYDWTAATAFTQAIPNEVTWTLSSTVSDGSTSAACQTAIRSIIRALKGLGGMGVRIQAICSDSFFDKLTSSLEVRQTYLNWEAAKAAREEQTAWRDVLYGGILFTNYRGTDDNSTVAIADKKCKFFPVGAGIFQLVYAPADERFDFTDSPGQESYSWVVPDLLRNMYVDVEMYSYPLPICTMPSALYKAAIS
jgi:hypothetical protein